MPNKDLIKIEYLKHKREEHQFELNAQTQIHITILVIMVSIVVSFVTFEPDIKKSGIYLLVISIIAIGYFIWSILTMHKLNFAI